MADSPLPAAPDHDCAAIETALAGTDRGRRFLADFARRSRAADTARLLDAVTRLERTISRPAPGGDRDRLRADLAGMAASVARARRDVSAAPLGRSGAASGSGEAGRAALHGIADAAERVQEIAWTMREGGSDPALCDALDARATEIYEACAVQEAARNQLVVLGRHLAVLDARIRAACRSWGVDAEPGDAADRLPPLDIDFVRVEAPTGPPSGGAGTEPPPADLGAAPTRETPPRLA